MSTQGWIQHRICVTPAPFWTSR